MYSYSASSISLHTNIIEHSDDYIIDKAHIDNMTYLNDLCTTYISKELDKISIDIEINCHAYFNGTRKIFFMNC